MYVGEGYFPCLVDGNLDRLRSCIVHFVYVEKGARERGRKGEEEEEEEEQLY